MKSLASLLIAAIMISGCGLAGGGSTSSNPSPTPTPTPSPTPTPANLQSGQWEFVMTPTSGNPVYIEANLVVAGTNVSSTVLNTELFKNGPATPLDPMFIFTICGNVTMNANISGTTLSGALDSPGAASSLATYSGTIATAQSVTAGSFTAQTNVCSMMSNLGAQGTFSGYAVPAFTGTYTGTLSGNGTNNITLQITQDSAFGISVVGTGTSNGVTTNYSIPSFGTAPNNGNYSNVIGAVLGADGTATNVNTTSTFGLSGHFNQAGTQLTIEILDSVTSCNLNIPSTCVVETGTLTKQ